MRTARDCELPLSVCGGGHDWAGRALRPGGLVLDLTGMNQVAVAEDSATAIVAGGASAADLLDAAQPYAMVTATGVVRAVGMAGLTMAGGYGPLCGRYGLALDNLLRAEVVLADGEQVTASPDDDAELFWALRGGGGNFGVVTSWPPSAGTTRTTCSVPPCRPCPGLPDPDHEPGRSADGSTTATALTESGGRTGTSTRSVTTFGTRWSSTSATR